MNTKSLITGEAEIKKIEAKTNLKDFTKELSEKVYGYFKKKNLSYRGGTSLYIKAFLLLSLYLAGYLTMVFGWVEGVLWWAIWPCMAILNAGIGMAVIHDASHQAFSKKRWVNRWVGYLINIIGASLYNWIERHTVRHHIHTNIDPRDEDVQEVRGLLRFHPQSPWNKNCRFQHISAWFLYSLMNIQWMIFSDFEWIKRYNHEKKVSKKKHIETFTKLILIKTFYFGAWIILPILLGHTWWHIILGWILMQMILGLIMTITFQMAHVVTGCKFFHEDGPQLNGPRRALHQILTTANFRTWLTWYIGGLNHQIEHHLFPNISHIYYPRIAPIVQKVCAKYHIPYNQKSSWWDALRSHYQMLKILGQKN